LFLFHGSYLFGTVAEPGGPGGAEPPPERFEPPLESFETRIEIRKSYVMSAFLGAQPPPEYFLGAEPPLELFSGSATDLEKHKKQYIKAFVIYEKKREQQYDRISASVLKN
jgi:hypothetical protein